jgi:hypothetical protein
MFGLLFEKTQGARIPMAGQINRGSLCGNSICGNSFKTVGKALQGKMVERMPSVCKAVIKSKGGYLKNLKK